MALGKGLGSLIPRKIPNSIISDKNKDFLISEQAGGIQKIPVDLIEANPHQPRQYFDHEELEELIESIKVHGIIQPIIVTKTSDGYQLIAGERRLRSAKIIGLNTVPAIVREAGEQEKLELALIENIQRKNLSSIEKAVAYNRLLDEFNLSQEQVAEKMGISRSSVANTVRLLDLPLQIQESLSKNEITEGHAKIIAGLETEKEQLDFWNKIIKFKFTVRDAETEHAELKKKNIPKVRTIKDPYLEEKQDMLRSKLNTKVLIKKQGDGGQVVIDFYSVEELEEIINQIVK